MPLSPRVEDIPAPAGLLAFPGKLVGLGGGRLALSDSGHHRLLLLDAEGHVERVVGSGEPGLSDGPFTEARFRDPQGMALDAASRTLLVADAGNHALREVDLVRRTVRTVAGTGAPGQAPPSSPAPAREVPLAAPRDVVLAGDYALVAMAGAHQVWACQRRQGLVGPMAGTGREGVEDGPFASATFSGPSALSLAEDRLYVADAGSSAVRYLDLGRGQVRTLVAPGPPDAPALLHPLALAVGAGGLLVADTGHGVLCRVRADGGALRPWFEADGELRLSLPSGLCVLEDGGVVVADTGHHRLVEIAPGSGRARVLDLHGIERRPAATPVVAPTEERPRKPRQPSPVPVPPAGLALTLGLQPPAGHALTPGSLVTLRATGSDGVEVEPPSQTREADGPDFRLTIRAPEGGRIRLSAEALVRGPQPDLCWPARAEATLRLRPSARAKPAAERTLDLARA